MSVTLYYHPFSRAANALWMLEEAGVEHELHYVDLMKGEQKQADFLALNPMGKLPVLRDGETVVTESAAIGLYVADRYAPGRLAPAIDDPARGPYLRWSLFSPSVIEPGAMAAAAKWDYKPGSAGWGTFESVLDAMEFAIGEGPYLLGEQFSMADCIFGGTLRYMVQFGMIEARPTFAAYSDRITSREAFQRADATRLRYIEEKGLGR